ncbi:MAG: hydroxyisourate hydrolase [Gemmatimonadaceae bacterium]|nr:hydroxyisourate hydrolase [Gemmatimonadaceae bacterium]NUR32508.1 hydroxyisourate hydrolase [Gemmatimonadaceae bacterium]NUS49081.1 hydroxyisourate hydrolase [Gemmatimonadaceae bacterium]
MSTLSTHVLDTALGRPAAGVRVILEQVDDTGVVVSLGVGETDADGRLRDLLPPGQALDPGDYRLRFDVGEYFSLTKRESFYPSVMVEFTITGPAAHYHVPLLLSPYGYSTYRGS